MDLLRRVASRVVFDQLVCDCRNDVIEIGTCQFVQHSLQVFALLLVMEHVVPAGAVVIAEDVIDDPGDGLDRDPLEIWMERAPIVRETRPDLYEALLESLVGEAVGAQRVNGGPRSS